MDPKMRSERRQIRRQRGAGDRGHWASKTEYLLVVAGNVVGLGNVWRFPYLCYKNGGGAFLLPYGLLVLVCGIPLFLLESSIGQFTQEGFITCWRKICPMAQGIGFGHLMMQIYGITYIMVQAWALFYLVFSFRAQLPWISCNNTWNSENCVELQNVLAANQTANQTLWTNISASATEFWERRMLDSSGGIEELGGVRWELVLCLLACWLFCYFSIWKGVKSSGKVVYFTATFPYVMLLILLIRGLTLPGAAEGIHYYLYPNLSRLASLEVWVEAGSQICFSYSLTTGNLNVLGSYSDYKNNCYKDCFWLCLLNCATSFVAGFAVFSVLGFMAHQHGVTVDKVVDSGPGLAFIVYPQATATMPLPQFWTVCFFLMLLLLAADTHFVMVECLVTSISDLFPRFLRAPVKHEIFVFLICLSCFLLQLLLVTQGGIYIFQLIDYYGTSRFCHYFMALAESVTVAWIFGADRLNNLIKDMSGHRPSVFFTLCWKFIIPLLSLASCILYLVDYKQLKINDWYVYPDWAYVVGWLMTLSSVVMVPLLATGQMCWTLGTVKQRLSVLLCPSGDPVWQGGKPEEAEASVELQSAAVETSAEA